MLKISHRGCLSGPNNQENKPSLLKKALSLGLYVECDLWLVSDELYLGHDKPLYETDLEFIDNEKFFCHAKDLKTLEYLLDNLEKADCFFHDKDEYTITKNNHIWTNVKVPWTNNCIVVMPEVSGYNKEELKNVKGICSDYILSF